MDLNMLMGLLQGQGGQGGQRGAQSEGDMRHMMNPVSGGMGGMQHPGGMGQQMGQQMNPATSLNALIPMILAQLQQRQQREAMMKPESRMGAMSNNDNRMGEMLNPMSGNMPNANSSQNTNFPTTGADRSAQHNMMPQRGAESNMDLQTLLMALSGRR